MKHVFVNFCLLQKHKCQCSVFRSHQVTILHFPLISKVSSSHLWTQHLANYQIYILMSGHTGNLVHFTKMQYRRSGNLYVYGAYNTYNIYNITRSGTQYGLFPISSKNQKITQPRNLSTAYSRHCRMFITTGSFLIRFPYLFMFN